MAFCVHFFVQLRLGKPLRTDKNPLSRSGQSTGDAGKDSGMILRGTEQEREYIDAANAWDGYGEDFIEENEVVGEELERDEESGDSFFIVGDDGEAEYGEEGDDNVDDDEATDGAPQFQPGDGDSLYGSIPFVLTPTGRRVPIGDPRLGAKKERISKYSDFYDGDVSDLAGGGLLYKYTDEDGNEARMLCYPGCDGNMDPDKIKKEADFLAVWEKIRRGGDKDPKEIRNEAEKASGKRDRDILLQRFRREGRRQGKSEETIRNCIEKWNDRRKKECSDVSLLMDRTAYADFMSGYPSDSREYIDVSVRPEIVLVREALKELNDEDWALYSAKYGEEMKHKEIGEKFGYSESYVGNKAERLRKSIAARLEGCGINARTFNNYSIQVRNIRKKMEGCFARRPADPDGFEGYARSYLLARSCFENAKLLARCYEASLAACERIVKEYDEDHDHTAEEEMSMPVEMRRMARYQADAYIRKGRLERAAEDASKLAEEAEGKLKKVERTVQAVIDAVSSGLGSDSYGRVLDYRLLKKLSRCETGEKMGVSESYVSRLFSKAAKEADGQLKKIGAADSGRADRRIRLAETEASAHPL